MREYLDRTHPNRYIGRGGLVTWPLRSPNPGFLPVEAHEVHGVRDIRNIGDVSHRQDGGSGRRSMTNGSLNPCADVVKRAFWRMEGTLNTCCDVIMFCIKNHINTTADILFFSSLHTFDYRPLAVPVCIFGHKFLCKSYSS